jgi:hypothetical protein
MVAWIRKSVTYQVSEIDCIGTVSDGGRFVPGYATLTTLNDFIVVQEGIESQAVDRVNRIGQTKPVHVYQLIAENTVEAKVLEIQERKKQLIQQVRIRVFLEQSHSY